jgi:hypothetical protein
MQGVLDALTNIVDGLKAAKDYWWEDEEEKERMTQHNEDDYDEDDYDGGGFDEGKFQDNDSDWGENGHFPPSRFAANSRKKRQKRSVKFAVSDNGDNEELVEEEELEEEEEVRSRARSGGAQRLRSQGRLTF